MRLVLFALAGCLAAFADSHPRIWSLASPDATSLVGIQWQTVRNSVFGEAFRAEFAPGGSLDLPDFEWLQVTDQLLIAGPEVLVIATGAYSNEFMKALPKGVVYRNVAMRGTSKQTAAMLNDQTLLMGTRKAVQAAIDRSLNETRKPNSMFAKAAVLAGSDDFWVVARKLPDPVASAFLPLDAIEDEVEGVEGGISFRDGLHVHGTLRASSAARAKGVSGHVQKLLPEMPEIARGMNVEPVDDEVKLGLSLSAEQVATGLKNPKIVADASASSKPEIAAPKKPDEPQVIRIYGLDEGPREIVLKKPDSSQPNEN